MRRGVWTLCRSLEKWSSAGGTNHYEVGLKRIVVGSGKKRRADCDLAPIETLNSAVETALAFFPASQARDSARPSSPTFSCSHILCFSSALYCFRSQCLLPPPLPSPAVCQDQSSATRSTSSSCASAPPPSCSSFAIDRTQNSAQADIRSPSPLLTSCRRSSSAAPCAWTASVA